MVVITANVFAKRDKLDLRNFSLHAIYMHFRIVQPSHVTRATPNEVILQAVPPLSRWPLNFSAFDVVFLHTRSVQVRSINFFFISQHVPR